MTPGPIEPTRHLVVSAISAILWTVQTQTLNPEITQTLLLLLFTMIAGFGVVERSMMQVCKLVVFCCGTLCMGAEHLEIELLRQAAAAVYLIG
jgi:hypothetical protein